MVEWLLHYWLQVIFSVFLGGVTIALKFIWSTIKKDYIDTVKKNQDDIKDLHKEIMTWHDSIDKKFDIIDKKFDNFDNKMDMVDKKFNNIDTQFDNFNKRFDCFNIKLDSLDSDLNKLSTQSKASDLAMMRDTLLTKMRTGIKEQCITQADFETVISLMNEYEKLGGDGEIHRYYDKYKLLNVCLDKDED